MILKSKKIINRLREWIQFIGMLFLELQFFTFSNKSSIVKSKTLSFLLIITLLFYGLQARSQSSQQLVIEAKEFVNLVDNGVIPGLDIDRAEQVMYGYNPAIYIFNNTMNMNNSNDSIVKIITDLESVSMLENYNPVFNTVEIIEIKVSSPSSIQNVINNIHWSHFQRLKMVFVSFEFQICTDVSNVELCEQSSVRNLFQNNFSQNQYLIYLISIAE